MIATVFSTCIVCGEDVLALQDSPTIAMCATHSDEDKSKALDKLQDRLNNTRDQIGR